MGNFLLNEDPLVGLLPFAGALILLALLLYLFRRNERLRSFRLPWFLGWPLALAIIAFGLYTIARLMNMRRLFSPNTGWHRALVETLDEIGPWRIGAALAGPGILILLWGLYAGWIRAARFPKRMCPHCRYDMTALPASLLCPECGRTAKKERDLFPFRRSRRLAILGLLVMLIGGGLAWETFRFTASGGSLPTFVLVRMVTSPDHPSEESLGLLATRIRTAGALSASQRQAILDKLPSLPLSSASALLSAFTINYPNDPAVLAALAARDQRFTTALTRGTAADISEAAAVLQEMRLTPAQLQAIIKATGAADNPAARMYLVNVASYTMYQSPTLEATLDAPPDPIFAEAALQCCYWYNRVPTAAQLKNLLALNDPSVTSTALVWSFAREPTEATLDRILADPNAARWIESMFYFARSADAAKTDAQLEQMLTMLDTRYPTLTHPQKEAIANGVARGFTDKPDLANPHLRRWRNAESDPALKVKLEDLPPYTAPPK